MLVSILLLLLLVLVRELLLLLLHHMMPLLLLLSLTHPMLLRGKGSLHLAPLIEAMHLLSGYRRHLE
jgi:hypothetical protein